MTSFTSSDGTDLHWEQRGDGPTVVVSCHWSGHPSVFEPLAAELEADHRVVTYDARGTGRSTRRGPHDMETGAADLHALLELLAAPVVVVAMTDACNRAVRVAATHSGLITAVVAPGTIPLPRAAYAETEAMIGSDDVVEAFVGMLETDYRSGQRTMMTTANPQMTESQVRARVNEQVDYCPREVGLARVRAWAADDPAEASRACGDRLWLVWAPNMVGPWFPPLDEVRGMLARDLPAARLEVIPEGPVSRPDLTAEVIRRMHAGEGA
jgi:pimeloyl-ACP methyl ester carboxylesterase